MLCINQCFYLFYEVIDCGTPHFPTGGITEPFNSTRFGASVTHHCLVYGSSIRSVCESNGEWYPDPNSTRCDYYRECFTFNSVFYIQFNITV